MSRIIGGRRAGPAQIRAGLDVDRVVAETIAALGRAENVYARGGLLVRVVRDAEDRRVRREADAPTIRAHTAATLTVALAPVACFLREDERGGMVRCRPPRDVLSAVLDAGAWPGVRPLVGVASAPIMRLDGTIAQEPGYDAASGYLLAFDATRIVGVSDRPSQDEAIAARDALLYVVQDFPFETDADKSAWLALVLTLLARAAIDGPCPMWIATANVRGAGKSRLVDCAAIVATGRAAARATQPTDDAEAGKLITSIVMAGDDLLLLDNIDRPLGGSKLDALLTGERWKDRRLGVNETIDLAIRLVLAATGNNILPRGDTIRRVLPIRLDSSDEHPEARTGFAIAAPLLAYVRANRPRLVACALTILRGWFVTGRPTAEDVRVWGSFEAWAGLVPHALRWIGLPDPQETRDGLERDDPHLRALGVVFAQWNRVEAACQRRGAAIREALDRLYPQGTPSPNAELDDLRAALETLAPGRGSVRVDARALGYVFRAAKRRVLGGRRLVEAGSDAHAGVVRWTVEP